MSSLFPFLAHSAATAAQKITDGGRGFPLLLQTIIYSAVLYEGRNFRRGQSPPNRAVNLHIKKLRPQKKNGIARTHSAKSGGLELG